MAGALGTQAKDAPNDALLRRISEVAIRRVARKRGVAVEAPQTKLSDDTFEVNVTYVDDGRVLDSPEDLTQAFEHAIQTELALKGYDLSCAVTMFRSKDGKTEKVGEEADEEDMFACEICDGLVKESDSTCPHCGAVFEDEEEEEPASAPPKRGGPPGPSKSGPPGPKKSGGPPGPSKGGPPGPKKSGGPPGPKKSGGPPGPSKGGPPGPKKSGPPGGPKKGGGGGPPGPKKGGPPGGPKKGGGPPGGPKKAALAVLPVVRRKVVLVDPLAQARAVHPAVPKKAALAVLLVRRKAALLVVPRKAVRAAPPVQRRGSSRRPTPRSTKMSK